jgi:hypothetical protein
VVAPQVWERETEFQRLLPPLVIADAVPQILRLSDVQGAPCAVSGASGRDVDAGDAGHNREDSRCRLFDGNDGELVARPDGSFRYVTGVRHLDFHPFWSLPGCAYRALTKDPWRGVVLRNPMFNGGHQEDRTLDLRIARQCSAAAFVLFQ